MNSMKSRIIPIMYIWLEKEDKITIPIIKKEMLENTT